MHFDTQKLLIDLRHGELVREADHGRRAAEARRARRAQPRWTVAFKAMARFRRTDSPARATKLLPRRATGR
jgi:hypothetical protein